MPILTSLSQLEQLHPIVLERLSILCYPNADVGGRNYGPISEQNYAQIIGGDILNLSDWDSSRTFAALLLAVLRLYENLCAARVAFALLFPIVFKLLPMLLLVVIAGAVWVYVLLLVARDLSGSPGNPCTPASQYLNETIREIGPMALEHADQCSPTGPDEDCEGGRSTL